MESDQEFWVELCVPKIIRAALDDSKIHPYLQGI
jgi:hypothetical protein